MLLTRRPLQAISWAIPTLAALLLAPGCGDDGAGPRRDLEVGIDGGIANADAAVDDTGPTDTGDTGNEPDTGPATGSLGLLRAVAPEEQEMMAGGEARQSPTTTRNYVRRSAPGPTRSGNAMSAMQMMGTGGEQP